MKNKNRYFLSEFIGSCFLVMIIVGSGLMAENLTNDTCNNANSKHISNWSWIVCANNSIC